MTLHELPPLDELAEALLLLLQPEQAATASPNAAAAAADLATLLIVLTWSTPFLFGAPLRHVRMRARIPYLPGRWFAYRKQRGYAGHPLCTVVGTMHVPMGKLLGGCVQRMNCVTAGGKDHTLS